MGSEWRGVLVPSAVSAVARPRAPVLQVSGSAVSSPSTLATNRLLHYRKFLLPGGCERELSGQRGPDSGEFMFSVIK